jgi:hypothetical protein
LRIGPAPATMPACNPRGARPTVHRFRLAAMTTIALERGGFSPWWPVVAAAMPVDTAIVPDGRPNGASIVLVVRRNDHSDRPRYRGHRSRPLTCTFAPPAGLEPAPCGLEVDPRPSMSCSLVLSALLSSGASASRYGPVMSRGTRRNDQRNDQAPVAMGCCACVCALSAGFGRML